MKKKSEQDVRLQKKDRFISAIAEFISGNIAHKSIKLEMRDVLAEEWAALRNASGVFGYATVEETEKQLRDLLS